MNAADDAAVTAEEGVDIEESDDTLGAREVAIGDDMNGFPSASDLREGTERLLKRSCSDGFFNLRALGEEGAEFVDGDPPGDNGSDKLGADIRGDIGVTGDSSDVVGNLMCPPRRSSRNL